MQLINSGVRHITSKQQELKKTKAIGINNTIRPKPEKIIVKASKVDLNSKEYKIVLGAIGNHATVIYKTNIASHKKILLESELDQIPIYKKSQIDRKKRITILQKMEQTPEIIELIRQGKSLVARVDKKTSPTEYNRLKGELKEYETNLSRYYSWQKNTLEIYENEIFPIGKMKANYLVALSQYHDKVDIITLFDKKFGKKASFALCRVPVSTMRQYYGDPTYDKNRYVVYPLDNGYKNFNVTVQDMAKYRENKTDIFDALTAKHSSRTLIPGQFAIIDDTQKEKVTKAVTPEHRAGENQTNAKVVAGVPQNAVAKR